MYPIVIAIESLWLFINYDEKYQTVAKWMANVFLYASAVALSVSITASLLPITYLGFLVAHVVWAFFAWKVKDTALFWQFAFFIPLDLYAMYIRL